MLVSGCVQLNNFNMFGIKTVGISGSMLLF